MDGGQPREARSPETFEANRSGIIIGIVVICWVLATTVVVLRVYTRKVLLNQIGKDDYFAVASLVRLSFPISGAGGPADCLTPVGVIIFIGHRRST